ncbi:hypothetical protein QFC21_005270 [Naganishia friedmannii]|uniref:Uncharacterized protein n=1 Tax=Naganishia friedmannii TaxID=89922 RepID=A0ACC2VBF2_9TREE|nr:hypothetical protein QFC21_005270 [Naganishia friedmannii]
MANNAHPLQPVVRQQTVDFSTNGIQGVVVEKPHSRGILTCIPRSSHLRETVPIDHELEQTSWTERPYKLDSLERRLNDVVDIGAQFSTQRQDLGKPTVTSRLLLRKETFTETQILAKVTINIKGIQLGANGSPKLPEAGVAHMAFKADGTSVFMPHRVTVDMGWVFKWKPIVNDPNIRMEVNFSPTVGTHNLVHDHSPLDISEEYRVEPHVEAKGIVSAGIGSWFKKKTQTIKRFTTFALACTPTDGQVKWQWHQTRPGHSVGGELIRDPQLSYQFGFRFTFKKPNNASRTATGSGGEPLLPPAVEISFCDFEVNFEPEHRYLRSVRLSAPQSELQRFSSVLDATPVDVPLRWPMRETLHNNCSTCGTSSPPPAGGGLPPPSLPPAVDPAPKAQ